MTFRWHFLSITLQGAEQAVSFKAKQQLEKNGRIVTKTAQAKQELFDKCSNSFYNNFVFIGIFVKCNIVGG